ncbi:hypothetical protein BYT27DRAFT_7185452 [Phlegmacium glaucopus]|nr:hypothetical protein BYT27DRAFT_7185452 [Phlegmacium glaucopus]
MSGFRQSSIVPAPVNSWECCLHKLGVHADFTRLFYSRTFKDVNMIETKDVGLYRDSRPCYPVDFRLLKIYSRSKISTL